MNEKNYFRNRIASEDNMKLFETTTHIEWDWRIETLAHIAVRLGMCFDIETDAVYLFTPIPEQKKIWTPYQKCSNKSQARRYDNINECLDYWKNLFPTYFSLGKSIDLWKSRTYSLLIHRNCKKDVYMLSCFESERVAEKYAKKTNCAYEILKNGIKINN